MNAQETNEKAQLIVGQLGFTIVFCYLFCYPILFFCYLFKTSKSKKRPYLQLDSIK